MRAAVGAVAVVSAPGRRWEIAVWVRVGVSLHGVGFESLGGLARGGVEELASVGEGDAEEYALYY